MTNVRLALAASGVAFLLVCATPILASAQINVGAGADQACMSYCAIQAANAARDKNPSENCPDIGKATQVCTSLTVTGVCKLDGCKATAAGGVSGSGNSLSSLSQLAGQVGQLLGQLMKSQSSGSGSGASPTTGTTGCTSYTPTSDPTQVGVNPCVYYVPSSANSLTCNDQTATNFGASGTCTYGTSTCTLAQQVAGTCGTSGNSTTGLSANPSSGAAPLSVTFTPTSIQAGNTYTVDPGDGGAPISITSSGASYTYNAAGTYTASLSDQNGDALGSVSISVLNPSGATSQGFSQILSNVGGLLAGSSTQGSGQGSPSFPGVLGNILLDQNGATIFASTVNSANNTEISGFFGSDTIGGQPQGIASQLCQSRPWAGNFLANVIPPSFFDSLCEWGGYQVGQPASTAGQPQVTLSQQTQTKPASTATSTSATSTPTVQPQAVIWAVPSSVPLGARTSIFWNTQGVTSCTETSPNGSFNENSLSGAAATVPITGSTSFTISCLDPSGNPITDYVTVSISN